MPQLLSASSVKWPLADQNQIKANNEINNLPNAIPVLPPASIFQILPLKHPQISTLPPHQMLRRSHLSPLA
jgi:hypothetical protein